jgi:Tol biopolymer transport system component
MIKKNISWLSIFVLLLSIGKISAQSETSQKDSTKVKKATKELPLEPTREFKINTKEATWLSLDISPDGKEIVFDILGDIYKMPITGGKAEALSHGMPYDVHPRYSPDGKSLVFISDQSGSDNVWILNLESKERRQLTKDKNQNYFSADWSTDGEYIVSAKGRRSIKLHLYNQKGGSGAQLIEKPAGLKSIDPAFSADGQSIYFSKRKGAWDYNAQLPQYQIGIYDMTEGKLRNFTSRYGSAFAPTPSPNGKWLVYGSRFEDETGLILHNLLNGDEKWLAYPVQRDEQESIAPLGVLPGMSFDPSSENLYASYGGKIYRINLASGNATEVPFEAELNIELGPQLDFKFPIDDNEEVFANQIRDAKPSPNGEYLVFTALDRLYTYNMSTASIKRLTSNNFTEAMPVWSSDGKSIAFVTWEGKEGHIYKVSAKGGKPKKLSKEGAYYSDLAWDKTMNRLVFIKGSAQSYRDAYSPFVSAPKQLVWMSANGGEMNLIEEGNSYGNPHFTKIDERVYLNQGGGNLVSIRYDGLDKKVHLKLSGITTYGSSLDKFHDHTGGDHDHSLLPAAEEAWREKSKPSTANIIQISPNGKEVLAQINNDIYQVFLPQYGQTAKISLAKAASASFPALKLTIMGGEFPTWSADSKFIHWSLGAAHFIYDLEKGHAFTDSLKAAKKAEKKAKEAAKKTAKNDSLKEDKEETKKESDKKKKEAKFKARELKIKVPYTKDIPKGAVLISGARIITMGEKGTIEKGDILIINNRIEAVGESGSLPIPKNAKIIDATGKTISPGFVDTHAHMWPNWGLHKNQSWIYSANLAYGVTTTRDPQTATTDVLTYGDKVEAGMMVGPRIYSTGPGVGFWAYKITSLDHAREVLTQYSEYYDTKTIKMYLTGNRQQRQWIVMACKELGLKPTTEGGLDYKLNMTQILDGYPGHEHALPIYPIYKEVVDMIAQSRTTVTPTMLVAYGGPFAENFYYATEEVYHNPKMQYYTPYEELASKSRRRGAWFMPEEHVFPKHAEFINDLVMSGGLAGVGSHGQLQGLGYHWELWAMSSGGLSTINSLRIATILGAESLGLDGDLGSIEKGKIADLVLFEENPLEDIKNTNTISHVVKNGRVYLAKDLSQVAPDQKPAPLPMWQSAKPDGLPGIKK